MRVQFIISTHTSRVGCDDVCIQSVQSFLKFLLTHPVWDVTLINVPSVNAILFLLTHPVWDVTVAVYDILHFAFDFYSHIPCGM